MSIDSIGFCFAAAIGKTLFCFLVYRRKDERVVNTGVTAMPARLPARRCLVEHIEPC